MFLTGPAKARGSCPHLALHELVGRGAAVQAAERLASSSARLVQRPAPRLFPVPGS
jgi:hypothetical protein